MCCALLLAGCSAFVSSEPPVQTAPTIPPIQPRATATAGAAPEAAAITAPTTEPSQTPSPTPWVDYAPDSLSAADCGYGGTLQSIEALDPYTVRFRLCRSDAAFLSKIAFPAFAIYPKEWLAQAGDAGFSPDKPVGSGPYRLAEWVRGQQLVLSAFEDYRQPDRPQMHEVLVRWKSEMSARMLALEAGDADGIDAVSVDDFDAIRSDATQTLQLRAALSVAYLGMNNQVAPFDDPRVRRAIAMGIDRSRLLAEAFPQGYEAAQYFTPCTIPAACSGEAMPAYDPAQARALLAEAGYPNGFQTRLYYPYVVRSYMPWPNLAAKNLKDQLYENLRIRVQPDSQLEDEFYAAVDGGALNGLYLLGWGADYPDADNFLGVLARDPAGLLREQDSVELRSAVEQGASAGDPALRQEAYARANTEISRFAPVVPLAYGGWESSDNRAIAFSSQVQGFQASPFGFEDFSSLFFPGQERFTFHWLQRYEPLGVFCPLIEDIDSLRVCAQIAETLYRYAPGSATVEPALAQGCTADESLQVWTCSLNPGTRFHDGTILDANDVVASFSAQWDAASPLHALGSSDFAYFQTFWPGFLQKIKP